LIHAARLIDEQHHRRGLRDQDDVEQRAGLGVVAVVGLVAVAVAITIAIAGDRVTGRRLGLHLRAEFLAEAIVEARLGAAGQRGRPCDHRERERGQQQPAAPGRCVSRVHARMVLRRRAPPREKQL
jgi:hypothetical protein